MYSCIGLGLKLIRLRAETQTSAFPPLPAPHLASRSAHIILALCSAFCLVRKTMKGAQGNATRRDAQLRPPHTNGALDAWMDGGVDKWTADRAEHAMLMVSLF